MFRVASKNSIDEYTDMGTEFIRKCIGDVQNLESEPLHLTMARLLGIWQNTNGVVIPLCKAIKQA
jgi:hypothetical protein